MVLINLEDKMSQKAIIRFLKKYRDSWFTSKQIDVGLRGRKARRGNIAKKLQQLRLFKLVQFRRCYEYPPSYFYKYKENETEN